MNFYFIPSLQHMAAVRIALCIYYDKEIERMLEILRKIPLGNGPGLSSLDNLEFWKLIETRAAEKLPSLPDSLKRRESKFIAPIHSETVQWFNDHRVLDEGCGPMDCEPFLTYKNNLCWKTDGAIDRAQTAKKFAQNKTFDPKLRFVMACTYFLEDDVLALWHGDEASSIKNVPRYRSNAAVRFWMKRLKRGSWRKIPWKAEIDGYFKNLRIRRSDTPLRISCFFSYLSWEGKKNYLSHLRLFQGHSDDFVSCLRAMDEGERVETVSLRPAFVLLRYLLWPLHYFFIDVAKQLWSHMNVNQFHETLLCIVSYSISDGVEDYAGLLKEFWHLSPASYKRKIKKDKRIFKIIEMTLNYDGKNASLSLPETLQESLKEHVR